MWVKSVDWFLYDNGLRHEKVKGLHKPRNNDAKCQILSIQSPEHFQNIKKFAINNHYFIHENDRVPLIRI